MLNYNNTQGDDSPQRRSLRFQNLGSLGIIALILAVVLALTMTSCDNDDWDEPYDPYGMVGTWQASTDYGTYVYEFDDDGDGCAYYVGGEVAYFDNYSISGGILSIDWDYRGWIDQGYISFTGRDSFTLQSMGGGVSFFTRVY